MNFNSNSGKHLTLEERRIILKGIEAGADKAAISRTIGKDKSSIGKEIKKHRICVHKTRLLVECIGYIRCKRGRTNCSECPDYVPLNAQEENVLPKLVTDIPNAFIAGLASTGTTRNVRTLNIKKCSQTPGRVLILPMPKQKRLEIPQSSYLYE